MAIITNGCAGWYANPRKAHFVQSNGTIPTDKLYTGQQQESGLGSGSIYYYNNAMRLATQTKSSDDILIGFRGRDGAKVVYERSTNTITFVQRNDIGSSFRPRDGKPTSGGS